MDIYKALGLRLVLTIPVDEYIKPPKFFIRQEAEGLRPDRVPGSKLIGSRVLHSGQLAEFYRATYEDVIAANQKAPAHQKAYLLTRVLLVDGYRLDMAGILALDNYDVEQILKQIYVAMRG